jgi:uncharacterized protein (TIGR00251 family)
MLVLIDVRVYSNAPKTEVTGLSNGIWQLRLAKPPVKGKANKELISFLSKVLGTGKNSVSIARGHTGRNKVIRVDGLAMEEIAKRLAASVSKR